MPALKKGLRGLLSLKGKTVKPERFEDLINALFENGFINVNGSSNQLADYTGYKAFLQIEEFENLKTHEKVTIEFIKEWVNGRVSYYIKEVTHE